MCKLKLFQSGAGKQLVSSNPTDPNYYFFSPDRKVFIYIFEENNFFVNKLSKYQLIVNFNVTSQYKQYRSPLMVINVSKLPSRLMEVKKKKLKKSFTDCIFFRAVSGNK